MYEVINVEGHPLKLWTPSWHDPLGNSDFDYCDDCPCSSIGSGKDYKTWEMVCGLKKNYSQ